MIQPLNYTNVNCCGTTRKQSFGQSEAAGEHKKTSKASRLAGYTATQFAAGAIVSGVFDGLTNLYRTVMKNKPLMPFKDMIGSAGYTGTAFAIIGLVFTAVAAAMAKRREQ